jgi:oligopeptide transport system permease protein
MNQVYNIIANVPYILFISVLVYVIGSGFWPFVLALTITGWLGIAYFIRTQVIIIRDREYNLASKCLGTGIITIVFKNILPYLISVIVTILASELPSYISYEVFLSYIGIGMGSEVSIGKLITEAESKWLVYPWQFWPPVAISAIVSVVLYVVGQNVGDASDPRTHMM